MTTLFIDRKGLSVRADGAVLAFYEQERRVGTVPLNLLERVCIRGDLQLSAGVLGKLGEHGVGVLVLSGRKRAPVLMMPNLRRDARRRTAQFVRAQDLGFCLKLAQKWVDEKLSRQHTLLLQLGSRNQALTAHLAADAAAVAAAREGIAQAQCLATLLGLEGVAAAHYFSAWAKYLPPSLGFSGRNRRPPRDAVNAALSLAYTVLHFETVRQIYLTGLDPFVGFYHALAHGRESLACDLLEPMRPLCDEWVLSLFSERSLRAEDFSLQQGACVMGKAGRMRFYAAYEEVVKTWRIQIHALCAALLADLKGDPSHDDDGVFTLPEMTVWGADDEMVDRL